MTRIATPENEATLLMWARSATASQLERICRQYRMVQSLRADEPEEEAKLRYVRVREMDTGFVRIEVQLPPEEAAVVLKALDAASRRAKGAEESKPAQSHDDSAETSDPDAVSPEVSASGDVSAETPPGTGRVLPEPMRYPDRLRARASRADALIVVAEAYLAGTSVASRTPPVELVVHVERGLEGATLDDGTRLSAETGARLACDASIVRVVEDAHGNPLDIGRRSRTIPPAMKRALLLRDRSCRFPGCTNRLVDGHHVVPWSQGGATRLANLVSLCRRHHRFVREGGYRIAEEAESEVAFIAPSGMRLEPVCTPPAVAGDGARLLRRTHSAAGTQIDARSGHPRHAGPIDYGLAVQVLLERNASGNGAVAR